MANEISRASLWGLSHYTYGEAYFGSLGGMRYRVAREPLEHVAYKDPSVQADALLKASVWPEPFAYAKTPAEDILEQSFPFSEEGMDEAVRWMNEQYLSTFSQK
ncbi:MAG: hypothetical protein IK016_08025 [Lachnospiraceae bacterium]|nr:hypothetical protein [Lachnospiraceae bacterium]